MAKWPYSTATWQKLRLVKLSSAPLCEQCEEEGRIVAATVVDHRIAISQGGDPFPELDGLASLCVRHHSIKTAAGPEAGAAKRTRPRSACDEHGNPLDRDHPWNVDPALAAGKWRARPRDIRAPLCPVTLICGAPGSGKSTLAGYLAGARDTVLDLDVIKAGLAGTEIYDAGDEWLAPALQARNRALDRMANVRPDGRLLFIVGAPSADEREWWADRLRAVEVNVLLPGRDECIARIKSDTRRGNRKAQHVKAAYRWYAKYSPRDGDTIIDRKDRSDATAIHFY